MGHQIAEHSKIIKSSTVIYINPQYLYFYPRKLINV